MNQSTSPHAKAQAKLALLAAASQKMATKQTASARSPMIVSQKGKSKGTTPMPVARVAQPTQPSHPPPHLAVKTESGAPVITAANVAMMRLKAAANAMALMQGVKRPAVCEPVTVSSKKRKTVATPVARTEAAAHNIANVCWDFVKNQCRKGANCPLDHSITSDVLNVKAHVGSFVKGRTEEEKEAAKQEYATWAEERLDAGVDPTGSNATSLDWWYCQVCLVCLCECDWNAYTGSHKNGAAHRKKFIADGGYALKPGVLRPDPQLQRPLEVGTIPRFISCAGFADCKVLSLGEQDYSFSLKVAQLQLEKFEGSQIVATSYLAAHDPDEPEVHVRDDGMRAHFSRRSLPGMDGALQKNIDDIVQTGAIVLHSVDATDLPGTLLNQCGETYDLIVFPFPRASLQRGCQPKNPRLLRNFFRSVNDAEILELGGKIGIVLLRTQFADWDTACLALEAGFHLVDHAALPDGFYQGREMSGKIFDSWKQIGAEIYMFQKT
mmetsp:Transcript_14179/g.22569  ORF Transcript_14179/g.22569 Transcript_14179/m.22569 type:complete len:495 (-) Transcript_14179:78-1562(-)